MKKGVTLVEVIIAATILTLALIPLLRLIITILQRSTDLQKKSIASQLAQDLMSEIVSRRWDENAHSMGYTPDGSPPQGEVDLRSINLGPDSGETSKSFYDDVDDFNGYSDGRGTQISIVDATGRVLPEYRFFNRRVIVSYYDIRSSSEVLERTNYKIATVIVEDEAGDRTIIKEILTNVEK
ncbi:MAG: hypothetical protein NZ870_01595 [bacterium]|nr:hypothetical protein [bacterium]